MRTEINKEIEAVSKAADPLKLLASADTMKVLGVQRPLLQVRTSVCEDTVKATILPGIKHCSVWQDSLSQVEPV